LRKSNYTVLSRNRTAGNQTDKKACTTIKKIFAGYNGLQIFRRYSVNWRNLSIRASELEEQGLIKAFEYTFELAWTTLKDFLEYRGQSDIYGSRDAIRKAFQLNLIEDGENWMDMLLSRNRTSHTNNRETAEQICQAVKNVYFSLFQQFEKQMQKLENESDET
jgi:nucleotidyltransferase substrate binding protein (TIGR01987 family)